VTSLECRVLMQLERGIIRAAEESQELIVGLEARQQRDGIGRLLRSVPRRPAPGELTCCARNSHLIAHRALRRLWSNWGEVLVLAKPIVRWHRAGVRLYWCWLSALQCDGTSHEHLDRPANSRGVSGRHRRQYLILDRDRKYEGEVTAVLRSTVAN
jgi:hypothetical protein